MRSVSVSLIDASGPQLSASAWITTMALPPNGMFAGTKLMSIPTAVADDVAAVRVSGAQACDLMVPRLGRDRVLQGYGKLRIGPER